MPTCRLCGAHFPNWLLVEGRLRNFHTRKYCLACSPFGLHNVRTLERIPPPPGSAKVCTQCGREKPLEGFYLRRNGTSSHAWCKVCNTEHRKARFREDRLAALRHYSSGDIRCACCGETRLEFLGLDHINDDGAVHRRELGICGGVHFYSWLRRTGYTYASLVVACHNCNMARAMYGECPHKRDGPVA
jgi:hypothetical protein